MTNYSSEDIETITGAVSVLDYFLHLENQGKVRYDSKKGHDYFFRTDNDKLAVTPTGFYSFYTREGGKILKAVMTLENKSWKEALDFLADFSNHYKIESIAERKKQFQIKEENARSGIKIRYSGTPNNEKLLAYFESRGISKEILQANSKQIHYENNGKKYFGIGMENISGGFEIRNPLAKIKIGRNDISEIKGTKNEMIVFEGMSDMFSFLELQKLSGNSNTRTLVSLNSITNVERFVSLHKDFDGKLFLCLDGDKGGDLATEKLLQEFSGKNIKDVRPFYSISEHGNNDLNDYLKNKLGIQIEQKITTFNNHNTSNNNGNNTLRLQELPDPESTRGNAAEPNAGPFNRAGQPGQAANAGGQEVVSPDAGNGPGRPERIDPAAGEPGRGSLDRLQQDDAEKSQGEQHSLGGGLLTDTTNIPELDSLILQYRGQKITNEQVAEVVAAACLISQDNKVLLKENLTVTEELKDIINRFKSGGIAKEGRGILDEYYTDTKIVDSIRNLIKDEFKGNQALQILEPSIGTGNFIQAVKDLDARAFVTAFEINETTAKIAKLFHPDAEINLRSFETEFIDDNGIKTSSEEYRAKYDLVIGNPPYGEHRGFYKGLGEEPGISKYEDYFVKRSLDVLKEGAVLAMVLPSGWLNRQKKLDGAELSNAFRLPAGAFAGTQIGTDIIILRKNSLKQEENISNYFDLNPDKILGQIKEKSNRFGRMEAYVSGSLEDALSKIQQIQNQVGTERIGNLFEEISPDILHPEKINDLIEGNDIPTDPLLVSDSMIHETQGKVNEVLKELEDIKFKSPAIKAEIKKYEKYSDALKSYKPGELKELYDKADKLIQSNRSDKTASEYAIQDKPDIKSKFLKYQFRKDDEIVPAGKQNNSALSHEELRAFQDTLYNGTIINRAEHWRLANFIDGRWVHDFYYAEGNIYEKLRQLEIDFTPKDAVDGGLAQYEKQKALLEGVLPKVKSLEEIIINPNHEFVHKFDLGTAVKQRYNVQTRAYEAMTLPYNLAEKFKDFLNDLPSNTFGGSSYWEVAQYVDNQSVTGSDKERNALVRERRKEVGNELFRKFIREELPEDLKERFVKDFNRGYNNIHVPDYSKFPLFSKIYKNFKGQELVLSTVQKAGIGRLTTKGVGLLAHEVGFGKTLSGILAMHEAMERGHAQRPLIAVPNDSIMKQWVQTIFETIPDAKVNVLGNLGKDYDLSKFDNKDGEITIVTYEGFNNIGFSAEVTEELASKFNYISASELKGVTNSERDAQIELQKEKETEGKMKRGKVYDWEDFGFDHLTFDEVHNANHIVGKVKIEDRGFASDFRNQNQQTSKIGINTWMAAQYIQAKQDGRNISLLSATPFTNKPLEYYSILSLIANKRLEESGYFNVNTFFDTFMEADNDMEIDAKGDVKFKTNVRRFKNNTLFQKLLSEFIDIKGEDDNPELIRPNKINKEYKIEQNDLTREQYDCLNDSFSETEKGAILTHILNARLIAISPFLSPFYDGEVPSTKEFVENSPKLRDTMNLIRQNKKDLPEAGQIIYSELAVSEFPKLKEYLVKEVGYKAEEIGIITGAATKKQRLVIQSDFNSGKVKIVIGSEAIQEGMNLQEKTTDTYILSLPYNFTSLRQVEGRSWRQGNIHENVRINFMLTNDSIDVFMLQKLQAKQARYAEAMKKGVDVLDISDIDTQELKTAIITDPDTRANIEIEVLKKKIESDINRLNSDKAFVLRKFETVNELKSKLTYAEDMYQKATEWSKEIRDGYKWKLRLPGYQDSIDMAKEKLEEAIAAISGKGINIAEIEHKTKLTDNKVLELEEKLENLPDLRAELVGVYRLEKEERLRKYAAIDHVLERNKENKELFNPMLKKYDESLESEMKTAAKEQHEIYSGIRR
ncbi:SNF2-related protein [uncultured Chryseobacterium sp.]|uniref:Eco57I restriction-modification methylase domain-containing protein n=1 Tax=uncultured Chryseobacterium sp. TaxID=259322 RepID=UPI0025CD4217|nr:SNF2-related protein [uncultured Chryseobacterium sp.]